MIKRPRMHGAGRGGFDQHIDSAEQFAEQPASIFVAQIQGDAALVQIQEVPGEADLLLPCGIRGVAARRVGRERPLLLPAWRLGLDHIGTKISEDAPAEGCIAGGDVEDANAAQYRHAHELTVLLVEVQAADQASGG